MPEPILVWGAGAVGGTIAAHWARAGIDVLLVDSAAEHVERCNADGLAITGPVETFRTAVSATVPGLLDGTFGRIVLAVKALDTERATRALAPHLADDGFVLSAQNGLNEDLIARLLGADRVMGAFVNFGADWHAPGEILYGNRGAVVVGEVDGTVRERTRQMHATMRLFEPAAVLTGNIQGYLWGKLGYGAMLIATALDNASMSATFAAPQRSPALIALAREVMAVAQAEGIAPCGFDGFDPSAFAPGADEGLSHASLERLAHFTARTAKTHSGVWRDLAVRRRRTEARPQLGAVIERGRERAVATPALATLLSLIEDIEDGRRGQSPETFEALVARCC